MQRRAQHRDTPKAIEHLFDLCHSDRVTGGMDRRPFRAASLAERTRRGAPPPGSADAPLDGPPPPHTPAVVPTVTPVTSSSSGPSTRRHGWVSDGLSAGRRAAGLLVEWRQLSGAWQGRVAYVVDVDGQATLVEAWLPSAQLERAADG